MLLRVRVGARVRARVFVFIPNEYEQFLRGNDNVMSYSVLPKTVSTLILL